jgi:hypothetical protein
MTPSETSEDVLEVVDRLRLLELRNDVDLASAE